ncbi:MAG: mismatch repair protein MutL [Acidobacteriaceae bacterium]|nr:mismatch repair protein MutL [Acidobacteriaceae bacterium]
MGRIHILADQVANQIAAGEVVDRPASVVKELLENSLDAGATRIVITVEAGGRRLIRIADDGCGMVRDDALLAFERHATSKLRSSDDLLSIATLGFRGEALPSIASIARVELVTRAAEEASGTRMEIAGGKLLLCEEAGAPAGTTLTVRDLFFNTPARRKFLKSENTELAHVTALVTHYALAHPDKHFELHSATHALLVAPPVKQAVERIFQIFGQDTLDQLLPLAAEVELARAGLPEPPPWRRPADYQVPPPGWLRISGFTSKPELEKLNRNSIYCFVNRRLVRDRLLMHAVSEAYRNILAPTSFPVVLLFIDMPPEEVDVNVHPAKTEVRFRQASWLHDFVRDTLRNKLTLGRPAAGFLQALTKHPSASPALAAPEVPPQETPTSDGWPAASWPADEEPATTDLANTDFSLTPAPIVPTPGVLPFGVLPFATVQNAAGYEMAKNGPANGNRRPSMGCVPAAEWSPDEEGIEAGAGPSLHGLASLRPLGQLRESFILAVNQEGLWIIDQHVAHERILFERVLRQRRVAQVERQRLLMPMLIDLLPAQMVTFAGIAQELEGNGFEVELFGPRTIAIKAAPAGLEGSELERMLVELLEQAGSPEQAENLEAARTRIAASIACHAAIKVNTPLDPARMEWLLSELAKTEHPTSCPHGRPIVLRYAWKEIQRAFHRI